MASMPMGGPERELYTTSGCEINGNDPVAVQFTFSMTSFPGRLIQ